jgi:hypothetical protein
MTLKDIDTAAEPLLATIAANQRTYVTTHGKCFQGLPTHAAPPSKDTAPDRTNAKPAAKAHRWADFCTLPAQMPFSLEINEYVTPRGEKGWVAIITAVVDGKTCRRSKGEGPENRDTDWAEVVTPQGK